MNVVSVTLARGNRAYRPQQAFRSRVPKETPRAFCAGFSYGVATSREKNVDKRPLLKITTADYEFANRLLSALILAWDVIPSATQGRLIRDATLMFDEKPDAAELPVQLLSFIHRHKDGTTDATSPLNL